MDKKFNLPGAEPGADAQRAPDSTPEAAEQNDALAKLEQLVERIVTRQLERFRQEAEGRVTQVRSEARAEAERLASMSDDERRRYQDEAAREREEQLNRREAELNRRELRSRVTEALIARGLPGELGEVIDCEDAERCAAGIDALEKAFREAVQRGVDERIHRANPLPHSTGDANGGIVQRMRAAAGLNDQ